MHHPPVDPVLSLSLIREQDPEVPELLHLSQSLSKLIRGLQTN